MKRRRDTGGNDIGNIIRQMRRAKGMTQTQLGEKVGVTYQQIQKYEAGKSKVTIPRFIQLARVFGVPAPKLLKLAEPGREYKRVSKELPILSDDELRLVQLFRNIENKSLQKNLINVVEEIAKR